MRSDKVWAIDVAGRFSSHGRYLSVSRRYYRKDNCRLPFLLRFVARVSFPAQLGRVAIRTKNRGASRVSSTTRTMSSGLPLGFGFLSRVRICRDLQNPNHDTNIKWFRPRGVQPLMVWFRFPGYLTDRPNLWYTCHVVLT